MPEHIHLLLSEPERGKLSTALQMLKQNTSHSLRPIEGAPFWEATSTEIRFIVDSWNVRRTGNGAALTTTQPELRVRSKSNRSGRRGNGNGWESCRRSGAKVKIPTLSHKTRQGWGALNGETSG
jgi:REP element-mobilizing transposase RayT